MPAKREITATFSLQVGERIAQIENLVKERKKRALKKHERLAFGSLDG